MPASLVAQRRIRDFSILDQYGREIARSKRGAVTANPRGVQTYSSHPETGLTIESLVSHHRSAERGNPVKQMDMWDGLKERHAEVRGMFEERNQDVSGCDFTILPGAPDAQSVKAAEALDEWLQNHRVPTVMDTVSEQPSLTFRSWMVHQLTCVEVGYACSNLVWDIVDGLVAPVQYEPIAARRFGAPRAEDAHQIWLVEDTFSRVPLERGLWSVSRYPHRNPYAAGLMRSCDWWIFFGLTGFKDWQIFASMFGLPLAIGYYKEGAGKASRDALEDAVRGIGQDGYAVLSDLTDLVIMETARGGDSSTVYPQIMRACEQMLTKLITGGTLNTDVAGGGAGSYNAAKVHEGRGYKMKRADARRLEDSFAASISSTFCEWNGFTRAKPPRLHLKIDRGGLDRAKELQILSEFGELSWSQVQEEHGLRSPSGPGDAVKIRKPEPAVGESGPSGKKREKE